MVVWDCLQQMADQRNKLYGLDVPTTSDMPKRGPISQIQQIHPKSGTMLEISQECIGNTPN